MIYIRANNGDQYTNFALAHDRAEIRLSKALDETIVIEWDDGLNELRVLHRGRNEQTECLLSIIPNSEEKEQTCQ